MTLPQLLPVDQIEVRLKTIFPAGTPNVTYLTRQMAARTVYVMLYVGAVAGEDRWVAPKQIYVMSDLQISLQSDSDRLDYAEHSARPRYSARGQRWFADNTREPIRDETLREGFVRVGAVVVRSGIPTTSSKPRYALAPDFMALFAPQLSGPVLETMVAQWQRTYLSAGSLARIQLLRRGAGTVAGKAPVTFPNGEVRHLEAGPSSIIAQAVIEVFAPRFLEQPGVVLLSESGNKVIARDDALITAIGLRLEADKVLPDLILFDLSLSRPLLVFVELVASDGPMSENRKQALLRMTEVGNYPREQIAFVTAYLDRGLPAFRKTAAELGWGTFVWFVSEPEHLLILREATASTTGRLADFMLMITEN